MASMTKEEIVNEANEERAVIYHENPAEMEEGQEEGRVKILKDILGNVELTISEMKELKGIIVSKHRLCQWESERIKLQKETQGAHGRKACPQLPDVALEKIFSSLSTKDVLSSRLVCQNWRQVATMELRRRISQELYFNKVEREEIKEYLEVMKNSQLLPVTSFSLNMMDIEDKDFHVIVTFFQIFGPVMESLCVDLRGCTVDPMSFERPLKMYLDGIQLERLSNLTIIQREHKGANAKEIRVSLVSALFKRATKLEKLTFDSPNSSVLLKSLEITPAFSHLKTLFMKTETLNDIELENLGCLIKLKRLALRFCRLIGFESETMKRFLRSQSETLEHLKLFSYSGTDEFMYEFPRMENLKILSIEEVKKRNQILRFAPMDWNESFPKLKELKMRGGFEEHWMKSLFPSDTTSVHLGLKRIDFPIGIRCSGYGVDKAIKLSVVGTIFPNIEIIKFSIQDLFWVFWCWNSTFIEYDPFLSSTFPKMKKIVLRCDKNFLTHLSIWDFVSSQEFLVKNYLKEFARFVVLNPEIKRSCERLTSAAFEIKFDDPKDEMGMEPGFVRKTFDCTWFLRLLRERVRLALEELSNKKLGVGGDGSALSSYNVKEEHDWMRMNVGNLAGEQAVFAEGFRFGGNPAEKKRKDENEWRFKIMKRVLENIPLEMSEMDEFMNILVEKERGCERETDWTKRMESHRGGGDLSSLPELVLEKIFACSSLSTKDIQSSRRVCRHWRDLATRELRKHIHKYFIRAFDLHSIKGSSLKKFLEVMDKSQLLPLASFHIEWECIQAIQDSEELNFFEIFAQTLTHLRLDLEHIHSSLDGVRICLEGIQLKKLEELKLRFGPVDDFNSMTENELTSLITTFFWSAQDLKKLKFKSDIPLVVLVRSLQNAPLRYLNTLSLSAHFLDKDLESLGLVVSLKRFSLEIRNIGFKSETLKGFLESQSTTLEYLKLKDSDRGDTDFVLEFPIMKSLTGFYIRNGTSNLRYPLMDWNKYFPKLQELKVRQGNYQLCTETLFPPDTTSRHLGLKIIDFPRAIGFGLGSGFSDCLSVIGQMFPNVNTVKISSDDFLDPILLDNFPNLKKIILRLSIYGVKRGESKNRLKKFVWDMDLHSRGLSSVKDYITRLTEVGVEIKERVRYEGGIRETYDCTWLLRLLQERIELEQLDEELEMEVEMKKRLAEVNLDPDDEPLEA